MWITLLTTHQTVPCICCTLVKSLCALQTAGEPAELQKLEAQHRAVVDKGDLEAAMQHEMQILATLLNSQFGQAHVDQQQGLVMLQVPPTPCMSCCCGVAVFRLYVSQTCPYCVVLPF